MTEEAGVSALIERGGRRVAVTGKLTGAFLLENGSLRVLLKDVSEAPPHERHTPPDHATTKDSPARDRNDPDFHGVPGDVPDSVEKSRAVWVDAHALCAPQPLLLRSELWDIPSGAERDVTLRSLTVVLAEHVSRYSHRIVLAKEQPGLVELVFYNDVPFAEGASYQASFAPVRLRCNPRAVPWRPPEPVVASRGPSGKARDHSHISHLPLWLEGSALWSIYLLESGRLLHGIQFSLDERHERRLISRFRLTRT